MPPDTDGVKLYIAADRAILPFARYYIINPLGFQVDCEISPAVYVSGRCKIKFVPSHDTGVFHSFRKERILLKKADCFRNRLFLGRGTKTRTQDTWFWRPLLYQLSYTPMDGLYYTTSANKMQGVFANFSKNIPKSFLICGSSDASIRRNRFPSIP